MIDHEEVPEELPENWREVLETVSEDIWQERLKAFQTVSDGEL